MPQPEGLLPGTALEQAQQPPASKPVEALAWPGAVPPSAGPRSSLNNPSPTGSVESLGNASFKYAVKKNMNQDTGTHGGFGLRKKKKNMAPLDLKRFPEGIDPDIPDIVNAWKWFQTVDADGSGILEKSEVAQLNHLLGLDWSRRRTKRAYDEMCAMTPYGGREGVSFEDFAAWWARYQAVARRAMACVKNDEFCIKNEKLCIKKRRIVYY